jgi:hypothetical protein
VISAVAGTQHGVKEAMFGERASSTLPNQHLRVLASTSTNDEKWRSCHPSGLSIFLLNVLFFLVPFCYGFLTMEQWSPFATWSSLRKQEQGCVVSNVGCDVV